MNRPKLLDLYCCAGGAGRGYELAGFDVYGVDINPQPNYPYGFHQGDAMSVMSYLLAGGVVIFTMPGPVVAVELLRLSDFVAVHGSPPCQASCSLTKGTNKGRRHINLIPATRALFARLDMPTVIENVQGSDLRRDLTLCGEMFGLGVIRHRYFELGGWTMLPPEHQPHRGRVAGWRHGEYFDGPYFAVYGDGGGKGTVAQWQEAMGIDWTADRRELAEAIPPAYTKHIGDRLMCHLKEQAA